MDFAIHTDDDDRHEPSDQTSTVKNSLAADHSRRTACVRLKVRAARADSIKKSSKQTTKDRDYTEVEATEKQANDSSCDPSSTKIETTGTEGAKEELKDERHTLIFLVLLTWARILSGHESGIADALTVTSRSQYTNTVTTTRIIKRFLEIILEKSTVRPEVSVSSSTEMHGSGTTRVTSWVDVVLFGCFCLIGWVRHRS
jgi:hypothetical protein